MPKITYFGVYGKAESMRMLLSHAKVAFEDERLEREAFAVRKAAGDFPSGQVPVYTNEEGK